MNSREGVSRSPSALPTRERKSPCAEANARAALLVVAENRVEHGCVLQVARDSHVRNRHELQARILHLPTDHRRDRLQDPLLHLANASLVSHRDLLPGARAHPSNHLMVEDRGPSARPDPDTSRLAISREPSRASPRFR